MFKKIICNTRSALKPTGCNLYGQLYLGNDRKFNWDVSLILATDNYGFFGTGIAIPGAGGIGIAIPPLLEESSFFGASPTKRANASRS